LLDWLARDFSQHQWNVKRLVKMIVMSAAYQQSSSVTRELLKADPENRLWSRAEAFRLPAEMLRDQALFVSGLLVETMFGAPVRPYELEASFKPSKRDKGAGLYRRSLYTYWKRTGPAPMMMVLDSAKRDVCRVKRERTATPLQSFVIMNSPQFVEASRVLAEKLVADYDGAAEDNEEAVVSELFRRVTSRRPTMKESAVLRQLLESQRKQFTANPEAAKQYCSVGDSPMNSKLSLIEVASVASVINAMLNYDEALMRR
jgi:hypothetical protein